VQGLFLQGGLPQAEASQQDRKHRIRRCDLPNCPSQTHAPRMRATCHLGIRMLPFGSLLEDENAASHLNTLLPVPFPCALRGRHHSRGGRAGYDTLHYAGSDRWPYGARREHHGDLPCPSWHRFATQNMFQPAKSSHPLSHTVCRGTNTLKHCHPKATTERPAPQSRKVRHTIHWKDAHELTSI